ncbi:MAG: metallophosphoesterase [Nannocystaceae bacterium]
MGFRFIHCSDIHLLDLQGTRAWRFLNKRLTGAVNLALKRRKRHDAALFDRLLDTAAQLEADRIVVTGDVTNLALESEFECVRRRFAASRVPITAIPGNHDAYTAGAARERRFCRYLAAHMDGERDGEADFPFVQRHGNTALIGLSSAVPSLPLYAVGRIGTDQLARLDGMLCRLREEGLVRIVLVHHPVVQGVSKKRHNLVDLEAFQAVVARRGAELVLHGHEHRKLHGSLSGPEADVMVHGISSGTSVVDHPGKRAAFSLYDVEGERIGRRLFVWQGERFVERAA